jgi:hypothetical protein
VAVYRYALGGIDMGDSLSLENEDGSFPCGANAEHLENRRNEQETQSEAERQQPYPFIDGGLNSSTVFPVGGAGGETPAILDTLPISARSTEKHIEWWKITQEEKKRKKFSRAFQRFMLGRGFDGEYRLLTLTTPESFTGDIHQAWRKFVERMCRHGYKREYFAVKEWNQNHTCQHLHVVMRLSYIEYQLARAEWQAVTGAVWIHIDKIYSIKGMANYLAKYILKGYQDNPGKRGYWYSYAWIHRKWHAFNKAMYKYGEIITAVESELIHGLRELNQMLDYMNWRMQGACLKVVRYGRAGGEIELIQF